MYKKTQILIDPSHETWILGGLTREIAQLQPELFDKPIIISNFRNKKVFTSLLSVLKINFSKNPVLFSSVTPLENYYKYFRFSKNKKALLFTHQDGDFSYKHIKLLKKVDLLFVFSELDKVKLTEIGIVSPIIKFIGGVNNDYFTSLSYGKKIAFIGTPVDRKNPSLFLDYVADHPELEFKIVGKGWPSSRLWSRVQSLNNLSYQEVYGPVTSLDLIDCSHFLLFSRTEGGPMTLIEAVAAGLIPICTNTGIVEDFLKETGYLGHILSNPVDFNEVTSMINNFFPTEHIFSASEKAKEYSMERLSIVFSKEIKRFL
jgi:hypothetical protein